MNTLFQHRHFHKFATYSAEIRWVKGHSLNAAWFQLSCSVQRWTFVKSGTLDRSSLDILQVTSGKTNRAYTTVQD